MIAGLTPSSQPSTPQKDENDMDTPSPDYYYRNFPSQVLPARTPFTRVGRGDAGLLFIYVSNRRQRWSVLLDKERVESIYPEARKQIPPGFAHVWLLEKCYSTRPAGFHTRTKHASPLHQPASRRPHPGHRTGRVVHSLSRTVSLAGVQGDVLSYHLQEGAAIEAAEAYTRQHHRRAVVGLLVWDDYWF